MEKEIEKELENFTGGLSGIKYDLWEVNDILKLTTYVIQTVAHDIRNECISTQESYDYLFTLGRLLDGFTADSKETFDLYDHSTMRMLSAQFRAKRKSS